MMDSHKKLALQADDERIINTIFKDILKENSHLMKKISKYLDDTQPYKDKETFKKQLIDYKKLLLDENDLLISLDSNNRHPLQVAYALEALNDPQEDSNFLNNIEIFYNEASNSRFYPRAKVLGQFIAIFLIKMAIFLMALCIVTIFMPVPIIVIFPLTIVALIGSLCVVPSIIEQFQPVLDSINAGSAIGYFFSKNGKKLEIPDSEQQLSEADLDYHVEDHSLVFVEQQTM